MDVLNNSPITEMMNKMIPSINIGFLPMISATLGRIKEPTNVPIKKLDPMKPIAKDDVQRRSYCWTQL